MDNVINISEGKEALLRKEILALKKKLILIRDVAAPVGESILVQNMLGYKLKDYMVHNQLIKHLMTEIDSVDDEFDLNI